MTVGAKESFFIILVVAGVTFLTRALPFLVFRENKPTPKFVIYLGKTLPPAIIGMLVVYCLRGIAPFSWPYGIPEATAVLAVVLLHVWKRNNLISICGGTVLYMVLVQFVMEWLRPFFF